jgi:protein SCO1/2
VSPTPEITAAPTAAKTPWDLKLFCGFVVLLAAGLVALLAFWKPHDPDTAKAHKPDQVRQLGRFAFTDQTGATITHEVVAGKFAVVNFIHSSCSISCLRVNQQMAEVQRLTASQNDVRLLSFTVDPRTDTPPVLAKFGEQFSTDATRWSMLTGNKTELYDLIEKSFLRREPLVSELEMPGGFVGVERIAVVDRTGKVRRYFDGLKSGSAAAIVKLLEELRTESR